MAFKWDCGDDFSSGGSYLTEPGLFHLVVLEAHERPANARGEPINNAAFGVLCGVVDGSVEGQVDKNVNLTFFAPNLNGKDQGKFARKKIDRFFIATNIIRKDQVGAKGVEIDISRCVGQQFCVKLEREADAKYLQVAFADIFHVDDPDATSYPKSAAALAMIPAEFRWAAATVQKDKPSPALPAVSPPKTVKSIDDMVI